MPVVPPPSAIGFVPEVHPPPETGHYAAPLATGQPHWSGSLSAYHCDGYQFHRLGDRAVKEVPSQNFTHGASVALWLRFLSAITENRVSASRRERSNTDQSVEHRAKRLKSLTSPNKHRALAEPRAEVGLQLLDRSRPVAYALETAARHEPVIRCATRRGRCCCSAVH